MAGSHRGRQPCSAPGWARRRVLGAPLASLVGALAALPAAACAAAGAGAAGAGPVLYVANAADGTVTRLDAAGGRALGPPLPAGPFPGPLVPGPDGSLLVLPLTRSHERQLCHVARTAGGWTARPVALAAGAWAASIAGAGGRHAVALVEVPLAGTRPPRRYPRLLLLDLRTGAVARTHPVGDPEERALGLAAAAGPAGPVAYVALWRDPTTVDGQSLPGRGRVLALDAVTGAVVGAAPLPGLPTHLLLAPAPGGAGQRLYGVLATPFPGDALDWDRRMNDLVAAEWWLLGLDPATLDWESVQRLPEEPFHLAAAPDGTRAYALLHRPPQPSPVVELDLVAGAARRLTVLRGQGTDLAVTEARIYVAHAAGNELWALDRRTGRLVQTIRVGRGPMGLALGR